MGGSELGRRRDNAFLDKDVHPIRLVTRMENSDLPGCRRSFSLLGIDDPKIETIYLRGNLRQRESNKLVTPRVIASH